MKARSGLGRREVGSSQTKRNSKRLSCCSYQKTHRWLKTKIQQCFVVHRQQQHPPSSCCSHSLRKTQGNKHPRYLNEAASSSIIMSSVRNKGSSSRKKTSGTSAFTSSSGSSSRPRGGDFTSSSNTRGAGDFMSSTKSSKSGPSSSARSDRSGPTSSSRSRDAVGRSRSGDGLTSSSKLPPQESLMEIVQKRFVSDVFESASSE